MKRILMSFFALILSIFASSQTTVKNPKYGMSTASTLQIEKIEIRDTATVFWFHVIAGPGNKILIPGETYIQPVGSSQKLFLISAEGIALNEWVPMSASGDISYQLCFPKIDSSVAKIDFGEGNEGGSWFIYDIQLKPDQFKSIIPEKITGNWFRGDNAQWEISLFDSVAVYKSRVWKYSNYSAKNGLEKISMKCGSKLLDIYAKAVNDSTCLIGETPANLAKYTNHPDESVVLADSEPFSLPVFKMDTVTYCGYIKGFSYRYPQRTGMIYVNNVLTGNQDSYLLEIEDDGTFEVKFPLCNPQGVLVRCPFSTETIFVEPGKTTFQLIDNGNIKRPVLFMGDCSRINSELLKLKFINNSTSYYYPMMDKILDFSPEQYKVWCQELRQKDLDILSAYTKTHRLIAKTIQVKELEINYRYALNLFDYKSNSISAYRKKNNIPQDQREIPFKPIEPDSTYYTFLNSDMVNNQLAVLLTDYFFFINRIKYLDILRGKPKGFLCSDYMNAWEKKGNKLSPQEKELSDQLKEIDTPEFKKSQDEFQFNYGEQVYKFQRKYNDKLQSLYKEKKDTTVTYAMIEKYLIGQNVELTDEEEILLQELKDRDDNPLVKKHNQFYEEHKNQLNQFETDHHDLLVEVFQEYRVAERNETIQKVLGIQSGFATDVMTSQDYCRPIVSEMNPITDDKLKEYQKNITTPFIANYLALKNKETKSKIEANKKLVGAKINEVPKTAGDKVFDAIMSKYKGKVVYVDFWATWCAPCRSGIEQIKPLKEEMANENVAFIYITNQTSPKTTYDNMIPTIKGEHYRVSADEWNILSGMFKISGIPHYVLVGKDGNVINPQLGHMENSQLKTLLMKSINE